MQEQGNLLINDNRLFQNVQHTHIVPEIVNTGSPNQYGQPRPLYPGKTWVAFKPNYWLLMAFKVKIEKSFRGFSISEADVWVDKLIMYY